MSDIDLSLGRLPFAPEPPDRLKARYPRALDRVFRISEYLAGAHGRSPAQDRAQVFDLPDGLRIIVSREDHEHYPDGLGPDGMMLHVSASIAPGTPAWGRYRDLGERRGGRVAMALFMREALATFRRISGDWTPLDLHDGVSAMGVPHWYRPWKEGGEP